jgi:hypothetical protein
MSPRFAESYIWTYLIRNTNMSETSINSRGCTDRRVDVCGGCSFGEDSPQRLYHPSSPNLVRLSIIHLDPCTPPPTPLTSGDSKFPIFMSFSECLTLEILAILISFSTDQLRSFGQIGWKSRRVTSQRNTYKH